MKRVLIPANAGKGFTRAISIVLPNELEAEGFDAVGKDFPLNLPDKWIDPDDRVEKKIEWISNFGLTKSGKQADRLPQGKKYRVLLPNIPRKFVYFDGARVRGLATRTDDTYPDSLVADLMDADPPVGIT